MSETPIAIVGVLRHQNGRVEPVTLVGFSGPIGPSHPDIPPPDAPPESPTHPDNPPPEAPEHS